MDPKDFQAEFRYHGWSLTGANLLAAACFYAKSIFLYFRPSIQPIDSIYALVPTILCSVVSNSLLLGMVIGGLCGGFYLLWRASQWRPADEIIRTDLDRGSQSVLVERLVNLCVTYKIDPDNLEDIIHGFSSVKEDFHKILVSFFRQNLKMKE